MEIMHTVFPDDRYNPNSQHTQRKSSAPFTHNVTVFTGKLSLRDHKIVFKNRSDNHIVFMEMM